MIIDLKNRPTTGSTSCQPDLDWSQVRETVRLLHLAVAQITRSLKEGDDSVERLGLSFTAMSTEVDFIKSIAGGVLENGSGSQRMQDVIEKCSNLSSELQAAIVAFQFYDRITQQLSHVSGNLTALSDLVSDAAKIYDPQQWQNLQNQIRSKFSMESERQLFEALMKGAGVEEAIESANLNNAGKAADNHVELF